MGSDNDKHGGTEATGPSHFIRDIIRQDLRAGKNGGRVATRFPPEPNGYLHIGHAKSICLNFGMAEEFGGTCNLRFDDTNPDTEEVEYIEAIEADVAWLGFDWGDRLYHASDYFDQLHEYAIQLIETGKAYVDSLSGEEIKHYRGDFYTPGKESPYRNRTVEENLDLFERMRAGEFDEGEHVLRARIDMQSPNMNMRDPILYRIRKKPHPRTGDAWCIYPMYDYTHCLSDAIEGITHSLCTLEFEDHRPLYDWVLDQLPVPCHPQQIEFARLDLTYTITSKRKLKQLVEEGHVKGWDDPRLPTLQGLRRRGVPPAAIRNFCDRVGVSKADNRVDIALLEHAVREALDKHAPRATGVLRPLRVVITDFPEDQVVQVEAPVHPKDPSFGTRTMPFSRVVYIERDDFMEDPPRKFRRLAPGREVRLRHAFVIKCEEVVKHAGTGEIVELRCTHDPSTLGSNPADGRKVKGVIHWVSAAHALEAEVRLYDRLFTVPDPAGHKKTDFRTFINPDSLEVLTGCKVEPGMADAPPETRYQFERLGYFCTDRHDSRPGHLVFNRIVTLRDTWAKIARQQGKQAR